MRESQADCVEKSGGNACDKHEQSMQSKYKQSKASNTHTHKNTHKNNKKKPTMAVKPWRDLLTMNQRVNQLRPRGCQPAKAVEPWRDLLTMDQRVNQLRPQHH